MPINKDALDKFLDEKYAKIKDSFAYKFAMAEAEKATNQSIKVNSMSNTPNMISWKGIPIPESWYSILTAYTAKYAVKIDIKLLPDTYMYLFIVQAGGPFVEFAITKKAAIEDVKCIALQTQLENAVKSMGLVAGFKPGLVSISNEPTFTPKFYSTSVAIQNPWGKPSNSKLTSLYEMYGMVNPKKVRYCKAHRPTAAEVWAKIEAAEKEAEVVKTISTMSPALKETFLKAAEKYLTLDNPFIGYLKGGSAVGGSSGDYYTSYGKQVAAATQAPLGGAISKDAYNQAKGGLPKPKPTNCDLGLHEWYTQVNDHIGCKLCSIPHPECPGCSSEASKAKTPEKLLTKSQQKKLKKAEMKAKSDKLAEMLKIANDGAGLTEPPEDLF